MTIWECQLRNPQGVSRKIARFLRAGKSDKSA